MCCLKKLYNASSKRQFICRHNAFYLFTQLFCCLFVVLFRFGNWQVASHMHNLLFLTKICPIFLCNAKYHATSGRYLCVFVAHSPKNKRRSL
ncbi:hypothetical protein C7N43_09935 [Sphingobacteriales bacterium UPWRP_1]|nr:hypothetical protein B6N25_12040 [Sphingobacteriales bacterium TSM_CSS]PSJ77147.1 hypothetical protein C7N43_09935 [Sphingobacteriales bacterium UPWRP_1]